MSVLPLVIIGAFFTRFSSRDALLRNPVRSKMLGRIAVEPGCTVRSLAQDAQVARMCVVYHLRVLRRAGMVRVVDSGGVRRVYLPGVAEGPPIVAGRAQREILVLLQGHSGGCSRRGLARSLSHMGRGTRSAALRRLRELGLVEEIDTPKGRVLRIAVERSQQAHYDPNALAANGANEEPSLEAEG